MKSQVSLNKKSYVMMVMLLVSILCFVLAVAMISAKGMPSAVAAETQGQAVDLSSYRKAYISDDNQGYTSTESKSLPFDAITSVSVKTTSGTMQQSTENGNPVLMLTDVQGVSVYMRVRDVIGGGDLGNGYKLGNDSWGSTQTGNNKQEIHANGTSLTTGKIATGALLVQTSFDGKDWKQLTAEQGGSSSFLSKFDYGYYTTAYLENFHNQGEKQIYVPDGNAVKQGVWVSVSFFYEAYHDCVHALSGWDSFWSGRWGGAWGHRHDADYYNMRETHTFFLVEDNPEVVTFNNMTTGDKTEIVDEEKPSSEDEAEYRAQTEQNDNYLRAVVDQVLPTMYDGSMSTTGIKINVTNNPYLTISAKRNGEPFALPGLTTEVITVDGKELEIKYYPLTQSGRYDITISSYSKSKSITLYVDAVSAEEAYRRYFGSPVEYNGQQYGDEFIDYSPDSETGNMRVFDANSSVPVFAGKLQLNLQHTDEYALPIYGVITNRSLGTTSRFSGSTATLTEFGEYEILFSTNKNYYDAVVLGKEETRISGDVRLYRFTLKLKGAPKGSVINRQLLSTSAFGDLSLASPSDYIPQYWGVTRTTLNSGLIRIGFADKESAVAYARDVIWGNIEVGEDQLGKYWKIPDPDYPLDKKISRSGWENATLVNDGAEKMVKKYYFDLTDPYSYLTLSITEEELGADVSTLNLSSLALGRTVVIWHSREQREAAIIHKNSIGNGDAYLKYIGLQPYALLHRNNEGVFVDVEIGLKDYRFVRDALGIDSYALTATDQEGRTISLNYEQGIFEQFKANNLAPGQVEIREFTIYGTSVDYAVFYITEQTATLTLTVDGETHLADGEKIFTGHEFSIETIQGQVDPETYVRVDCNENDVNSSISYFDADEICGVKFNTPGVYTVSLIDRFGNSRRITIQLT